MLKLESPVIKTLPGVSAFTIIGFCLVPLPNALSVTSFHSPFFKIIVPPVLTFLMAELYSSIVETVMDWAVAKKLEKRSKTVIFLSKIFINILLNY